MITRSIAEMMDLDGRTALVVGGAGHIGAVACAALADLGARVVVADSDHDGAVRVAERITHPGGPVCVGRHVELADDASIVSLVSGVTEEGPLDVLFHGAALVGTSPLPGWTTAFEEQSAATWRRAIEVNLTSAFVLCREAAPALGRRGLGSIILVSSIYGHLGPDPVLYTGTAMGSPAAYFASKGGLNQLARFLASSLAPAVRVNVISPGGIARGQHEDFVRRYEAKTPLGRMGTEQDLAGAVAYLASDLSSYVTGINLVVDGGLSVR